MNAQFAITFEPNVTIKPIVQLLSVISPSCKNLLPKSYQKLMEFNSEIMDLFPQYVQIDMLYKHVQHKCIPYVPNIDIERIMLATDNIELNIIEQERNKIFGDFIFCKNKCAKT